MRFVHRGAWAIAPFLAVAIACVSPSPARADEPVSAKEPRMMSETGEVTTVIDALDNDDPFDVNLSLGFVQSWKHANISA